MVIHKWEGCLFKESTTPLHIARVHRAVCQRQVNLMFNTIS